MTEKWSEAMISRAIATQVFLRKHLVIVPNCYWPGSECDLLVVTPNLRIIDVEVKIARSDLKADLRKDKWYHHWDFKIDGPRASGGEFERRRREWPAKVWKHYYAMPKEVWKPEFKGVISPASGVILLERHMSGHISARPEHHAKPNRDAKTISPEDAVDIARLASLRLWDAFQTIEDLRKWRAGAGTAMG